MLKKTIIAAAMLACLRAGAAAANPALDKSLFDAVMKDDRIAVAEAISKGANVNAKDAAEKTPLYDAAYNKTKAIAELLISKGADVNAKDKYGASPLHAAVEQGKKDLVELLLASGADLHAIYSLYEGTALHRAAAQGDPEVAALLISKGLSVSETGKYGTLLHVAATAGKKEMAEYLISKGADVNAKNTYGATPLHEAADHGRKGVVELLVAKGADLSAKTSAGWGGGGATALHKAAEGGYKEIAEFLLAKGADIESKNLDGASPLYLAAYRGQKEIVEFLIAKKADVNAKNKDGDVPLSMALMQGKMDIAEALIRAGADLKVVNSEGRTLLHSAALNGDARSMELLLGKGADVEAVDNNGRTPLSVADSTECVKLLLARGADANAKDKEGKTPLHYAARDRSTGTVERLLAKGAQVDAKDKDGQTPLYFAAWYKKPETVKLLLARGADPKASDYSPTIIAAKYGDKAVMDAILGSGISTNMKLGPSEEPLVCIAAGWGDGNKAAVDSLIAHGANVNAKTKSGNTALHDVAMKEIVRALLAKGADVNAKGQNGWTPLHAAISHYSTSTGTIAALLSAGADVGAKDDQGRTPLQMTDGVSNEERKQAIIALLQAHMAKKSTPRQLMTSLLDQFKGHSDNDELRRSIIAAALKMKPAPAIPAEAEDAAGRGAYIFKSAKSEEDTLATAKEYLKAVEAAPWVANYYYNLCAVLEKTPYMRQALHACKLYLEAAPNAPDASDIRQTISGLKFAVAKNDEQIKGRTALRDGGPDDLYRSGGVVGQAGGYDAALKVIVDWQESPPRYRVFRACIEGESVKGGSHDLVATDAWVNTCQAGVSMHLVIRSEGQGYVELSQGSGGIRTTIDELFQQKLKALAKSPLFVDSGYGSEKGARFYASVLQGGPNNQTAGYDMFECDCNGKLLRQDPRALPDDFVSIESKIASGFGRFSALIDYKGVSESGCNGKFAGVTGYHFGEKE
ncbi:MAG: ankyrin repeat domain-containing protein [Elusimicrobia bacterium]|nr:ankyrin repeat domain-containing protein [Elusimicrobiota bacterium]